MTEILPCPFCGGKEYMSGAVSHDVDCYIVKLVDEITEKDDFSQAELMEAWNTRAEFTCYGCRFEGNKILDYSPCETCVRSFDDNYEKGE